MFGNQNLQVQKNVKMKDHKLIGWELKHGRWKLNL